MNMNQLKLSFRNVTRQSKRTLMLGLAMGFGVMMAIVINALTQGMSQSAIDNFSKAIGGHIYITGAVVSDSGRSQSIITDADTLNRAIASMSDKIDAVNYRSSVRGSISFGANALAGTIQGVDFNAETTVTDAMTLIDGHFDDIEARQAMIIPESAAREMNVSAGDSVFVKAATLSGQQNLVEWIVGAVVADSDGLDRMTFYAPRAAVNELIAIEPDQYQQVNLALNDLADMDEVKTTLQAFFGEQASLKPKEEEASGHMAMIAMRSGNLTQVVDTPWEGTQFDVTSLNDAMSDVMSLVEVLKMASNAVFVVILFIILVGITNSYRMVILERVQEIGTMRAMGAQRHWVFNLFISEALMIAVLGSAVGIAAAIGSMTLLGLVPVGLEGGPMQLFAVANQLQFPTTPLIVFGPVMATLLIAVVAVFLPARQAARLAPGDALRAHA